MVAKKDLERLENSAVKLTVTVDKAEAKKAYEDLLKKYAKTVQIKGFRKGKVPPSVLERKFGESLKSEAMSEVMEESLKEAFEDIEAKPLGYALPEVQDEDLSLDLEKDFTFTVKYDTFPEVEPASVEEVEIEKPQVSITKEDIDRELSALQEQNAIVQEKKSGAVEKDDIVTVDYWEIDEDGNPIEDTKREDFVFTVGSGYNLYKIDDDVIGMKQGEEKVIEKEFPEDFAAEDLAGKKKKIGVKVSLIKQKDIPELDDDLAQDISEEYETLDDLKEATKKRLEENAQKQVRTKEIEQALDQLIEKTEIALPESMIEAELNNSWQNLLGQNRLTEEQAIQALSAEGKGKESILEDWRPNVEKKLRSKLILQKLIEKEDVDVTQAEVDEKIKEQAESANMPVDRVKQYYNTGGMMDYLREEMKEDKIYDMILEKAQVKKGKNLKYLDLLQGNE
ncbi:MAG: trigger factor [Spirochaetia bacterium]